MKKKNNLKVLLQIEEEKEFMIPLTPVLKLRKKAN